LRGQDSFVAYFASVYIDGVEYRALTRPSYKHGYHYFINMENIKMIRHKNKDNQIENELEMPEELVYMEVA
jgi:hypothetical protein